MKGLFWKDLRQVCWLPLWLGLGSGLLTTVLYLTHVAGSKDTYPVIVGAWILAAVLAPAGLISREVGDNTLAFLSSMPVTRRRIWLVKLLASLAGLVPAMAGAAAGWAVAQFAFFGAAGFKGSIPDWESVHWMLLCVAGQFCLAWLATTLVDRATGAAALSLVIGLTWFVVVSVFESTVSSPHLGPAKDTEIPVLLQALLIPGMLLASYLAFARGETMRTAQRFKYALLGVLAGGLVFGLPGLLIVSNMHR